MTKNQRIIIIADSLAMPRPEVPYEKTWIYLLKKALPHMDIIDRSARGTTSFRLISEGGGGIDLLEMYDPAQVILQMGITECAPRLFKKSGFEFFFMNRILSAGLRNSYIQRIKKTRQRNPALTDISPENFYRNLRAYCNRSRLIHCRVYMIAIAPPSGLFEKKSPFIRKNINEYNAVLKRIERECDNFMLIDPYAANDSLDLIAIDELHVNADGQKMIFDKIIDSIRCDY